MQKITPMGTNLLVVPFPEEEAKSKSGLILPNAKYEATFRRGTIEAIGKGDKHNNMKEFKRGNIVYYSRIAGTPVTVQNEIGQSVTYHLVPYDKCVGVL